MRLYPFAIDGFGFCPSFSHRLQIARNSLCSISRHAMVLKWANPSYGNIKEEKRRHQWAKEMQRIREWSCTPRSSLFTPAVADWENKKGVEEQAGELHTKQGRLKEREWWRYAGGHCGFTRAGNGERLVKTKEVDKHTHTHTGKCWSMVPVWEGGEGALIVHKPQMRNPLGLAAPGLTERREQRRSAGRSCLCQGMAELAADTQNPLNRTWPGGSTVCTKPRGHSNTRRLASWTTCLVSSHGKCFIHQHETHTHIHTRVSHTVKCIHLILQYTRDPSVKKIFVEKWENWIKNV